MNTVISSKKGFTLIELLIVVAIIAILAAIAVPNFLEAQTRAKVSRTMNDLRTQATALESYLVDHNVYTRDSDSSLDTQGNSADCGVMGTAKFPECANGAMQLTTPIAYMSSLLTDPFANEVQVAGAGAIGYRIGSGSWSYPASAVPASDSQNSHLVFQEVGKRNAYVLIGVGPDGSRARMSYKNFPFMSEGWNPEVSVNTNSKGQPYNYTDYDPTNGSVSVGDVYRFGGEWNNGRFMKNGETIGAQNPLPGEAW